MVQGKKFLKRSEIEELRLKKLREEEERERQEKVRASGGAVRVAEQLHYTGAQREPGQAVLWSMSER